MKVIGIIALTAMIAIPSSSFAWGPRRGGGVVRPFFPGVVVGGHSGRVPFGFFPNRAFIAPNRFIPPTAYGSYYSPTYAYPPYPPYAYPPPYSYYAVPPPSALGTDYDRGYSEGYSRGYEEARKELSRERHEEDKTPGDAQGKESGEGGQ